MTCGQVGEETERPQSHLTDNHYLGSMVTLVLQQDMACAVDTQLNDQLAAGHDGPRSELLLDMFWNRMRPRTSAWNQQRVDSGQQTRNTTTETWIACGNSTWHASKHRVHKLHQTYILKHPLVEFMHLVLTCIPAGVRVCDSGPSYCVPFLLSSIKSLCLLAC